jgi:hypothetical protein
MGTFILIAIIVLTLAGIAAPIIYFGIGKTKGLGRQVTGKWAVDAWTKGVALSTSGNTFSFDFPVDPSRLTSVNTIEKTIGGLTVGGNVSITFEITGKNPVFIADGLTPQLRIYIGRGRLYSLNQNNAALKIGKQTLTIPLTPDNWKDVTGVPFNQNDAQKTLFTKAIQTAELIGPCFGDEHGNAHGVSLASGSAKFSLISFTP